MQPAAKDVEVQLIAHRRARGSSDDDPRGIQIPPADERRRRDEDDFSFDRRGDHDPKVDGHFPHSLNRSSSIYPLYARIAGTCGAESDWTASFTTARSVQAARR